MYIHQCSDKVYTVADAKQAARIRLNNRKICVDGIIGRKDEDVVSLKEFNEIADHIVSATLFWGNK